MADTKVDDEADDGAFAPKKAARYWTTLGPVVTAAVNKTASRTGREARSLYPVATAFVLWAWQTKGLELDVAQMFRRRLVEEYVHRGMESFTRGSRATYRSVLLTIVDTVTPPSEAPFPIPRSDPTPPYNSAEIAALRSWAGAQGSTVRRRDAAALLAMGFGAGLATRELLSVRTGDIDVRGDDVHILVWSGRPRLVPVLPAWQPALREAIEELGDDQWVFRIGRTGVRSAQVTDFLHRGHKTELDVRPARMRTTWLLTHLQARTPPGELLRIAGLEHLAALDRIRRFLPSRAPLPPSKSDFERSRD
ncbi:MULTISPECIES: hypothetical protein [unclassified Microbacterium]|uniref:hypothetical protein n=1 Tax=Microbacterium TaxID=33882 RepID=UPI000D01A41C|nr:MULTISPECIES: hypothetical protein [unclassified Microbacterium]AVL97600.1 hypothetical protein C6C15_11080 [Microbacterium sp. str. 'China']MDH5134711.1 hypothetical protein [Microbacterium sp. RD10]MDH5138271.1 hypothetical protein [Microbacterium sp. RD11]MDH5146556.1 hypothetical protein [Microbacterium sp. RD12]MDH5156242.1 hypothetical protein [Microbacterium sp. RD06]